MCVSPVSFPQAYFLSAVVSPSLSPSVANSSRRLVSHVDMVTTNIGFVLFSINPAHKSTVCSNVGASLCDKAAGTSELGYKGCLSFPHWTWHGFVLLAVVEEQSEKAV